MKENVEKLNFSYENGCGETKKCIIYLLKKYFFCLFTLIKSQPRFKTRKNIRRGRNKHRVAEHNFEN